MSWNGFAITAMELARGMTLAGIDGLTDEEMMFQPKPGMNHALWLLGHISTSESGLILHACTGKSLLPGGWGEKFGIKSQPVGDAGSYPSKEEVLGVLAKTHAAAMEYVSGLAEEDLDKTPVGIARFPAGVQAKFGTVAKCIAGHITHESSHAGQMAVLRRLMGKQPRV
jgi:hypothetical protein